MYYNSHSLNLAGNAIWNKALIMDIIGYSEP